jgi:opacity protein-like surface antigen
MRAGWDFNGWLVYGTLGAAFSRVSAGQVGCSPAAVCAEATQAGWTGCVGVETMFWRNWSAKLEYIHYDLGNRVISIRAPALSRCWIAATSSAPASTITSTFSACFLCTSDSTRNDLIGPRRRRAEAFLLRGRGGQREAVTG